MLKKNENLIYLRKEQSKKIKNKKFIEEHAILKNYYTLKKEAQTNNLHTNLL